VLHEIGASEVERVEVYNKCDLLEPSELGRMRLTDPTALFISAKTGEGRAELLETLASRLALDVRRVTLEFDARAPDTAERVARVYRHARVLRHITRDGRVSIDADVPRRALPRLQGSPPV
jgi:GTP-binding protein HflX